MTPPAAEDPEAACLLVLEGALASGDVPDLRECTPQVLDGALQALVKRHRGAAAPVLRAIAEQAPAKDMRKTARLAIYRLEQAGVTVPPAPGRAPIRPAVRLEAERPVRAWLSGIDGTGSRAVWIVFEGGLGGRLSLCSLILNDEAGILESAGGAITRKRLDTELRTLREHQKLPWVETDPARACALVGEALALHVRAGTEPPAEFSRWRRLFATAAAEPAGDRAQGRVDVDPYLLDLTDELLELPELAGWFVDPGSIQEDSLALLQARESRLVVSDQIKAEREAAIVDAVIDKHFTTEARQRWSRRLREMASIFRATNREEPARRAECAAAVLADDARSARTIPLVRGLALRGLTVGAEVALGRVKLADVSRAPARHETP
jgi:hypothetical protein